MSTASASKSKKVLLIVEDEPALLTMLESKFKTAGFRTIVARDGETGLKVALDKHPDLIILDLLMPHLDGVSMLKQLRIDTWGKHVPVIVATNLDHVPTLNECLEQGIEDYYVKSEIELDDLVNYIQTRLDEPSKHLPSLRAANHSAN